MKLNRRKFLYGAGGLGAVSLAMPMLPSLSRANPGGHPKRLVVFFSGNGTIANAWTPESNNGKVTRLSTILKPLEPHLNKINVIEGLDIRCAKGQYQPKGGFHAHERGLGGILTGQHLRLGNMEAGSGYANGISVDQFIANRLAANAMTKTEVHSLQVGLCSRRDHSRGWYNRQTMTYSGADSPLFAQSDGQKLFDALFKDQNQPDVNQERIRARRQSVLDFLKDDYNRVYNKISAEDRIRLDAHTQAFRDMEKELEERSTVCEAPMRSNRNNWYNNSQMTDIARIQIDNTVRALACDLTRVATIQFGAGLGALSFDVMGKSGSWHGTSHLDSGDRNTGIQLLTEMNTYIAHRFAYLLKRMDEYEEANGKTLLDNSIVLWVNEMGKGDSHNHDDVPIIMAGGCDDFFDVSGRHLQFGSRSTNDLLISLCHAMGQTDVTEFGIKELCTGPISELRKA